MKNHNGKTGSKNLFLDISIDFRTSKALSYCRCTSIFRSFVPLSVSFLVQSNSLWLKIIQKTQPVEPEFLDYHGRVIGDPSD